MKKLFTLVLLLITLRCLAPVSMQPICIETGNKITELEVLIGAVTWVESKNNPFAFNAKEGAVGAFQIRQCRVDHYNRLRGTDYRLEDFYDYELSREMFVFFARGKTPEQAARSWNGSGEKTTDYWNMVRSHM